MSTRGLATLVCSVSILAPTAASGQAKDKWEVNLAPLYLWASALSGEMSVNRATVPVFMSFGDATDHLSGIFTLHVEARKGRWGMLGDVGFVRLTTQTQATLPGLLPSAPNRTVSGDFRLRNTIFEAGASYLVAPAADFSLIGGIRAYTLAPKIDFTGTATQITPVDTSETSVNAFGGFLMRPKISKKWTFVGRADVGGGSGLTWSGAAGLQFQMTGLTGVLLGYRALGVDTGEVGSATALPAGSGGPALNYHMTHYGPVVALNLRWGAQ